MTRAGYARRWAFRGLWALAVSSHNRGQYTIARAYTRLAGEAIGVELAAPVSLALGGVR